MNGTMTRGRDEGSRVRKVESSPASFPRDLPRETRERIEGPRLEEAERRGSGSQRYEMGDMA